MALFEFLPAILAVMVSLAHACSEPVGKDTGAQPLQERAKVVDYIVYGKVVSDQMPTVSNASTEQEYKVLVEPLCWLQRGPKLPTPNDGPETTDDDGGRGQTGDTEVADHQSMDRNSTDDGTGFSNITVVEVKVDCIANDLKKGVKYILFLKKVRAGYYRVTDVNVEPGAIQGPEDADFEAVYRGIDAGKTGEPEGECLEGVNIPCFVGDDDRQACSKGVAMGVAVWSVILAAAVVGVGY